MSSPNHIAIFLILGSALLHALWNAVVKGSSDRVITIGLIALGNAIFGLVLAQFVEAPGIASYPYIVLTILLHLLYFVFLVSAYQIGDFSQVYPIARGVAPMLVAFASMVFIGEYLTLHSWAGVLVISGAIGFLVFSNARHASQKNPQDEMSVVSLPASRGAVSAALLTGVSIAGYTIVDGIGVRVSGSALGYIAWSFGAQIVLAAGFLIYRSQHLRTLNITQYVAGTLGGVISAVAYGLAIFAMNMTTLASVSAIRETSVIIASLIGVVWFGERPWKSRVFAAILVACGVVLIAN